ncbi:MAG: radical SAM protein, partial [Nanoarchaeota archaeon]
DLVLKNHLLMNSCNSTQKEYFNVFATQPLLVSLGNGCSNACPFCDASCSPLVERSPKEFVRDVIKINNETGHRYFFIGHWNVSRNEAFMEELITALEEIEEELLFGISIEAKSFLKPEHFRRLKKAGCVKIDFGIETASPRLMKIYRKNSSREVIQDAIKMAHDAGLFVGGNIICSLPGETDEDFEQTVEFCRPLSKYIHRWLVNTFILFEHSIVYKRPEKFDVKIKEPYVNSSVDLTKAQNCSTYTAYYYDWKTANSEEYQRKSLQKQNLFFSEVDKQLRFSFAGYDYLHSLEKVDQLIKYAEDMVSISLGLGSNQNLLEMRTPVESKQRFAEFEYLHHLINERIRYDKEEKRTKLLLIGGEPLIHPEIFRILKMIKKNNFEAVIRTNARMLANERFCEILGKFCEEILVVDPANEKEAYEKISQVPGSWDQSRKGMENWKKIGKKVVHFHP